MNKQGGETHDSNDPLGKALLGDLESVGTGVDCPQLQSGHRMALQDRETKLTLAGGSAGGMSGRDGEKTEWI